MTTRIPDILIDMDRDCPLCGKKGATEGGLCLACITKKIRRSPMKTEQTQPSLIKVSDAEKAVLKHLLSGMVGEYIQLEEEKKAADADWNERMGKLWEQIQLQQARIEAAE